MTTQTGTNSVLGKDYSARIYGDDESDLPDSCFIDDNEEKMGEKLPSSFNHFTSPSINRTIFNEPRLNEVLASERVIRNFDHPMLRTRNPSLGKYASAKSAVRGGMPLQVTRC